MQLGLKIGNTFLVDEIESLNFKQITEGDQFLIVKEAYQQCDFLSKTINSYIIGTFKNCFYNGIYCFDKNDIEVDFCYEYDYDEDDNKIENSEKIVDIYNELENDNINYLFLNNKKYILSDSVSFDHDINQNSHVVLKAFYEHFFQKGFSFHENMDICQEDKNIVNKAIGYKINDKLAIIFNIEIKCLFDKKFPDLQRNLNIYLIACDGKYDNLILNENKFYDLLKFVMENINNDVLNVGKEFLITLDFFKSNIVSYINSEKSKLSLYLQFSSLKPYYFLSQEKFDNLFNPFFIDVKNNIKCYYDINNEITYRNSKNIIVMINDKQSSLYTLQEQYKDIYRCVLSVNEYNDKGDRNVFNPYTGEINGPILYEDYKCKLYKDVTDSWNKNKESGIIPIGRYWVSASSSEIKEAIDRKNTMEELKNCQ